MTKLKVALGAFLVASTLAFGVSQASSLGATAAPADSGLRVSPAQTEHCCHIFWMGRWWCMPC